MGSWDILPERVGGVCYSYGGEADNGVLLLAPPSVFMTTYKPTKAELAAIRKGEAEIARGEYVTLTDLLNDLDPSCGKSGTKAVRKASR